MRVAIKKNGTTALVAGDILAGTIYYFTYDGTFWQLVAVPGVFNADAVVLLVTQALHGFSTGQAVYFTGSVWAKAKADAGNTLGVGVVVVIDANNFSLYLSGFIVGLSGLTAGQYYFVSDATAGLLTSTEPTTQFHFSNPLLFALSSITGIVFPFRPSEIEPFATTVQFKTGTYAAAAGDIIFCDTSGGGFTITLPDNAANVGREPIKIKKTSADFNALTVATSGADTIDGQPTAVITIPKTAVSFFADGAGVWQVF